MPMTTIQQQGFHITYNCTFLRKVLVKNVIANLLEVVKRNVISVEGEKT